MRQHDRGEHMNELPQSLPCGGASPLINAGAKKR